MKKKTKIERPNYDSFVDITRTFYGKVSVLSINILLTEIAI